MQETCISRFMHILCITCLDRAFRVVLGVNMFILEGLVKSLYPGVETPHICVVLQRFAILRFLGIKGHFWL